MWRDRREEEMIGPPSSVAIRNRYKGVIVPPPHTAFWQWNSGVNFCNFPWQTIWQQWQLHTANGQVCGGSTVSVSDNMSHHLLCLKHTVIFRVRYVVVQFMSKPLGNECKWMQYPHKYQKQVCMCVFEWGGGFRLFKDHLFFISNNIPGCKIIMRSWINSHKI